MNKCLFNTTHITSATTFTTALKESKRTTTLPPTGLAEGPLFPWICWTIWTTRNQLIFENRVFSPLETLTKAICLAREWQEAQVHGKVQDSTTPAPNRRINATNTFAGVSVYTDASWKEGSNNAGLGWIFTDHLGSIIIKESKLEEFLSSPLMAESLAIREALLQARRQGYSTLTVFLDAQTLVRAINDGKPLKELFGIIHDILQLSLEFSVISFVYISRLNNTAADALAKGALIASSSTQLPV